MGYSMDAERVCALLEAHPVCAVRYVDALGMPCDRDAFIASMVRAPLFADLTYDSRAAGPNALFVCKGAAFKEEFLHGAAANGASAYLAQKPYGGVGIPGVIVDDIRRAMAVLACAFFQDPSERVPVVAVTGTKGKTTVAFYLDAVLKARAASPSALLTGVVVDDGTSRTASHNTTPEAIELQRHLARAVDAACDAVVMEASSQGFKYERTWGTRFAVGVFTNIGEDHVSPVEHPTFEDYFASKLRIFEQSECAVVNLDIDHRDEVLHAAKRSPRLLTYSASDCRADVWLLSCRHEGEGRWNLAVRTPSGDLSFVFNALGRFNVSNALAAIAAAEALGVDHASMTAGLASVHVPGRMERYDVSDGSLVGIVDYAHNEMSMEALLRCVREEFPGRQVTVVFGATGDRGVHRRIGLGRAAGSLADRIILTEDDPGPVPVSAIAEEIGQAIRACGGTYQVVEERPAAVRAAVQGAARPAVVVLAGKGVEDTIRRAEGTVPCKTDVQLFCEAADALLP